MNKPIDTKAITKIFERALQQYCSIELGVQQAEQFLMFNESNCNIFLCKIIIVPSYTELRK